MAAWRFRRSKKILPGVRLNVSRGGPSVSLGTRGARVNVGRRGVTRTFSLPGTGLYNTRRVSGGRRGRGGAASGGCLGCALPALLALICLGALALSLF